MNYTKHIAELKARWESAGKAFKPPAESEFIPAFENGKRITVSFRDSEGNEYERARGTVAMSTGWSPVFLLMLRKNSTGSRHTLSSRDRIVG